MLSGAQGGTDVASSERGFVMRLLVKDCGGNDRNAPEASSSSQVGEAMHM